MAEIDDLLSAMLSDDVQDRREAELRIRDVVRECSREDALRLLSVVGRMPPVDEDEDDLFGLFGSVESSIVLSVCAMHADADTLRVLQQVEPNAPASARTQMVRSAFEIAVRTRDPEAMSVGLDMADRLVANEVPISPLATTFYWLQTTPMFPDLVVPRLEALAAYAPFHEEVEVVRAAYGAVGAAVSPSFLTRAELRQWAQDRDDRLLSTVVGHVLATAATLTQDAAILLIAYLVAGLETDVMNGGYNQYFWNHGEQEADATAVALDALEAADYALLHRRALEARSAHAEELDRLMREDTPAAFQESYRLEVFDVLDDEFVALDEADPLIEKLTEWLAVRVELVADALGVDPD